MAERELLVDDVHTFYGDSYVLQGVSISMGKGTVVAVLGRNGVGKTTLVRTVIAFTPARRGRVLFAGQDVTRLPAYRVAQAGMALVPQGRRVFASLTVRENLEIANGRSAPTLSDRNAYPETMFRSVFRLRRARVCDIAIRKRIACRPMASPKSEW